MVNNNAIIRLIINPMTTRSSTPIALCESD
jgi:hypothetical protein